MDSRLEAMEKVVEMQVTRFDLQDARLKKLEDMMMRITQLLDDNEGRRGEQQSVQQEEVRLESEGERASSGCGEKWRKLEIPIFAGEDAYGWANKLERYFQIKGVTEEERMSAVMVALEGRALSWFQWWESCNPNPSWGGFKTAVIRRFQPTLMQNPFELLLALKQTHLVEDYIEKFEMYAGALKEMEQEYLMSVFLNGLRKEIRAEVKLYEPKTLSEMMSKALLIEVKNQAVAETGGGLGEQLIVEKNQAVAEMVGGSGGKSVGIYRSFPTNRTVTMETNLGGKMKGGESIVKGAIVSQGSNNVGGSRGSTGEFTRLSHEEIQEKYKKGLCFRCDEKFGPVHVYKNKQLRMLILADGDADEDGEQVVREEDLEIIEQNFKAFPP